MENSPVNSSENTAETGLLESAKRKIEAIMSDETMPDAIEDNKNIDALTAEINESLDLKEEQAFTTQELVAMCRDAAPMRKEYLASDKSHLHPYNQTLFASLARKSARDSENYRRLSNMYRLATGEQFPNA